MAELDGAIAELEVALNAWAGEARALLIQTSARTNAMVAEVERVVQRRKTRLAALRSILSAAGEADRRRLAIDLAQAEDAVTRGEQAAVRAQQARATARSTERQFSAVINGRVQAAVADLGSRRAALDTYRDGRSASSTTAPPSASANPSFLERYGLSDVRLEDIDYADNPIVDGYRKGGTTQADFRWAVSTWEDVVAPAVREGATRQDFERRDTERASSELRRTAAVYDLFLGGDHIRLERRSDGSLDVIGGRHRIEAARSLGLNHLPAEIK